MSLPSSAQDLTPEWLTQTMQKSGALERGRVRAARAQRIAEGVGLMARLFRVELDYEGADARAPRTLIAKLPIDMPQNLGIAGFYRFYDRECDFYQHYADRTPLRVAKRYGVERDGAGNFVLLLEDLGQGRLGDQVVGNRAEDAVAAIEALGTHHAAFWGQAQDLPHLVDYDAPEFAAALAHTYGAGVHKTLDAYPSHFTPALRELTLAVAPKTTELLTAEKDRPRTLTHGDFRSDNVFYDLPDAKVALVDWQICGRGHGPFDVAYHLTQSVTPEVRRAIEKPALEAYLRALQKGGVKGVDFGELWESYRINALFALVYPVVICGGLDLSNPRERALGDLVLSRCLSALDDLNAAEKLPA
jgi:hypothetical protein